MNLLSKVSHLTHGAKSIIEWLGDGGSVVDRETANRRAQMCLSCPKHTSGFPVTEGVAMAIKRHLEAKSAAGLRVDNEKSLHTCSVCGCAMRLKIWQNISMVKKQMTTHDFENFENPCWQRDEKP